MRKIHVLALVPLFVLTGCGSGGAASGPAGRGPESRAVLPASSLLTRSEDEGWSLAQASRTLLVECVRRAGIAEYALPPVPRGQTSPRWKLFGFEDLRPVPPRLPHAPDPALSMTPERQKELSKVLSGREERYIEIDGTGIPGEGCQAEVDLKIYGSEANRRASYVLRHQLDEVARHAHDSLSSNSTFTAVKDKWRECMKNKGHAVREFDDVSKDVDRARPESHPRVQADVACKKETNLLNIGYKELAAAEKAELDKQPGLATQYTALRKTAQTNAAAVLKAQTN